MSNLNNLNKINEIDNEIKNLQIKRKNLSTKIKEKEFKINSDYRLKYEDRTNYLSFIEIDNIKFYFSLYYNGKDITINNEYFEDISIDSNNLISILINAINEYNMIGEFDNIIRDFITPLLLDKIKDSESYKYLKSLIDKK